MVMKNTKIDCRGFSSSDYPEIKKGMYVILYNGEEGAIEITDGYYHVFYDFEKPFHTMDIKYIECDWRDLSSV